MDQTAHSPGVQSGAVQLAGGGVEPPPVGCTDERLWGLPPILPTLYTFPPGAALCAAPLAYFTEPATRLP